MGKYIWNKSMINPYYFKWGCQNKFKVNIFKDVLPEHFLRSRHWACWLAISSRMDEMNSTHEWCCAPTHLSWEQLERPTGLLLLFSQLKAWVIPLSECCALAFSQPTAARYQIGMKQVSEVSLNLASQKSVSVDSWGPLSILGTGWLPPQPLIPGGEPSRF